MLIKMKTRIYAAPAVKGLVLFMLGLLLLLLIVDTSSGGSYVYC